MCLCWKLCVGGSLCGIGPLLFDCVNNYVLVQPAGNLFFVDAYFVKRVS